MVARAAAFVDGLNLYHGLRDAALLNYRWLDVEGMADSLAADAGGPLGVSLDVTRIVYCTSPVADKGAARRQDIYLQALQQHCSRVEIRRGTYEEKTRECARCGTRVGFQTEKQTDVNLAVEKTLEAAKPVGHRAEVHLLVTGDTDLLPAVRAARSRGIEVVAIAPPARARARGAFNAVASKTLRVLERHLRDNLLPDVVELTTRDGEAYPLRPPGGWTPQAADNHLEHICRCTDTAAAANRSPNKSRWECHFLCVRGVV